MNSKHKGDISEAFIIAKLLRMGYSVSKPVGDNQRYDLIIDVDGTLYKVQSKTATLQPDGESVEFQTASTYAHRGGARRGYVGQADLFLAYAPHNDEVYWEWIGEETPTTARTLYLVPKARKTTRRIMANDRLLKNLTFPTSENS